MTLSLIYAIINNEDNFLKKNFMVTIKKGDVILVQTESGETLRVRVSDILTAEKGVNISSDIISGPDSSCPTDEENETHRTRS